MYHISITENGKPVVDVDSQMISAVIRLGREDSVSSFQAINVAHDCTVLDRVNLLTTIDDLKEAILDSNPDVRIGYMLKDLFIKGNTKIDVSEMMRQALDREEGD